MNRAQRRAAKIKPTYPVFEARPDCGLADGDLVTIGGIRKMRNGRINAACTPGSETVFIVRIKKAP